MRYALGLLLCSLLIAACSGGGDGPSADPTRSGTAPPNGALELEHEGTVFTLELASTAEERGLGLGRRDSLPADAGMLFDLGEERVPSFWMKDMRFPLDMVWIDAQRRVVSVTANVEAERPGTPDSALRRYSPEAPVRYVLELNAGRAASAGIEPGDVLRFGLPTPR